MYRVISRALCALALVGGASAYAAQDLPTPNFGALTINGQGIVASNCTEQTVPRTCNFTLPANLPSGWPIEFFGFSDGGGGGAALTGNQAGLDGAGGNGYARVCY